jgi:hypothetical protein
MNGREERIRLRAYHLWEANGCFDGKEVEHWFQAESEINAEDAIVVPAGSDRTGPAKPAKIKQAKATTAKPRKKAATAAVSKKPAATRARKPKPANA